MNTPDERVFASYMLATLCISLGLVLGCLICAHTREVDIWAEVS
jgi:hypothetical protein